MDWKFEKKDFLLFFKKTVVSLRSTVVMDKYQVVRKVTTEFIIIFKINL